MIGRMEKEPKVWIVHHNTMHNRWFYRHSIADNGCQARKVGHDYPSRYTTSLPTISYWIRIRTGVAFDRVLHRLGHGKGYYDSFIASYVASERPKPLLGEQHPLQHFILWRQGVFHSRHLPPRTAFTSRPNCPTYFTRLGCGHFGHSGWNNNSLGAAIDQSPLKVLLILGTEWLAFLEPLECTGAEMLQPHTKEAHPSILQAFWFSPFLLCLFFT
jgi:hypothetical protein